MHFIYDFKICLSYFGPHYFFGGGRVGGNLKNVYDLMINIWNEHVPPIVKGMEGCVKGWMNEWMNERKK